MTTTSVLAEEQIPLHRLIKRREAEDLLDAFQALMPGVDLALIRLDGRRFAGTGEWSETELSESVARAQDGQTLPLDNIRVYPLYARSYLSGVLVARTDVRDSVGQEAILRGLHRSLTLILAQALEKRDVAAEALERYREVNLLYSVSETIGARLDPAEIPPLVLNEARRVIQSDAAVVLLPSADAEDEMQVGATFGEPGLIESLVEMTRDVSRQALLTGRPSIVTDLPDRRASLGAILCAPLKTLERVVGAVLMGRLAGAPIFTAGDEKLLMALTGQAAIAIEKARLHQEEIKRQRLEEELAVGQRIQLSLLPKAYPTAPGWEFAARYQAARQVGGDLYDFIDLQGDSGQLGMVVADVTGKGVAAALFMAVCRTALRMEAVTGSRPADILARVNRFIAVDLRATLFLSAFYASLDVHSGELAFANGGHNWPLWLRAGEGACEELSAQGIVLGAFADMEFEERRIEVGPGDVLVFFTDGVTEAMDPAGRMFEDERLQATVVAHRDGSAEQVAQAILDTVKAFTGDTPQSDDLTLFVVKRQAAGP